MRRVVRKEWLGKNWLRFVKAPGSGLKQPEEGVPLRTRRSQSQPHATETGDTTPSSHTAPLKFASSLRVSFSHIMREFLMDCPARIFRDTFVLRSVSVTKTGRRSDLNRRHRQHGRRHERSGWPVPLRRGAFRGDAQRRLQFDPPLHLLLLPDARRRRCHGGNGWDQGPAGRGCVNKLPLPYRISAALLLFSLRNIHTSSTAI